MTFICKRNGRNEVFNPAKLTQTLLHLNYGLNSDYVQPSNIVKKVEQGLSCKMTSVDLDTLTSEVCASLTTIHPDYSILAARVIMSQLHKETPHTFSDCMSMLYYNYDVDGNHKPLLSKYYWKIINKHKIFLNENIENKLDFDINYFGIQTLKKSYLLRKDGKVIERPQYMFMRVAIGIHANDLSSAIETYKLMSGNYFIHATPTLFGASTIKPQLSSCFLLSIKGDSIAKIFETVTDCANISKSAGGIGLNVHKIRCAGSNISGSGCLSNGIVPMLRVFNNVARYVDQGGGKRMGAFAIYLEPWHADIFDFLNLKKNHGIEEHRARDLFYGLWIPDLFMQRVERNENWSLMCPERCSGLSDVWGKDFDNLYEKYEKENKIVRTIPARTLWHAIIEAQVETGTPYMLYKDACNRSSNQQNLGTIQGSNLCAEIVEYSSPEQIAVCNLASVALPKFVENKKFNFTKLQYVVGVMTVNLNKIIDINEYPLDEARVSNLNNRPIGIGVQGLADVFAIMKYPFDSAEAAELNHRIFETIYFAALSKSCELAQINQTTYKSYKDSPISKGILHFDFPPYKNMNKYKRTCDWDGLREKIKFHGLYNSLLIALMPTASTAQILGNNESFEPFTTNIYVRRVLSGEFQIINSHLVIDLIEEKLWTDEMRNKILSNRGSIQNIEEIPNHIKEIYKTVWEISCRTLIDMSADRAQYVDQSQSFNLHVDNPTYSKLSSIHFYAWKCGLKTGMYYLRTKPAANAIQFTVDNVKKISCTSCSS